MRSNDGCTPRGVPDYESTAIPSKPPAEYSYVERRADLLQQVLDVGHPSMLNQSELAERYEVTQQQISKDFDRLGEYLGENLGSRRYLSTAAVIDRSIRGMLENEEYRQAARTVLEWNEWLDHRQDLEDMRSDLEELMALEESDQPESDEADAGADGDQPEIVYRGQ